MSLIILSITYCSTRLKQHLLPNERLCFIGMNPIPDEHNNLQQILFLRLEELEMHVFCWLVIDLTGELFEAYHRYGL